MKEKKREKKKEIEILSKKRGFQNGKSDLRDPCKMGIFKSRM